MKLRNLFFVNVLIVLLCFIGGQKAFGQEVEILNEDFESYDGNATSSAGWSSKYPELWTGSSETNCSAKIENLDWNNSGKSIFLRNVYDSNYFNKYAEWNTEEIDISTYENVSFSIDAAYLYGKSHDANGRNRVNDLGNREIGHMIIEYQIAGGAWRTLIRIDNNKITNTYTVDNINSSSIIVRAKSKCTEPIFVHNKNKTTYYEVKYVIDNFILKGTKKASVTAEKVLWLKADEGVSPSSNNWISSWSDQSGKNNNVSSYNGINEYKVNSLNYNPGIRFDESNTRFMTISDSPSLRLNEFSVFSVIKPINITAFDAIVSKHSSSYESGFGLQYLHDASHLKLLLNTIGNENADDHYPYNSATVAISNTAHIAGGIYDKTNIRVFTDIDESRYSYNDDIVNNDFDLVIGADHTSIDAIDIFDGDINEIMIYNYAVDDDEKNKIESYLAIKYGITLNHDYVSSSDYVMYTYDDYKYDIAGLAKDDSWGLNQKISSSSNKISSDASNLIISTSNSFNTTNKDNSNSLEDGESIVWGKNDGDKSAWITEGNYKYVGERWKVNKNSDIYWTYFQLNLSAYPTPDSGSQYFLLIDDDETTANGITKEIQLTRNTDLYNAAVNLSSGISYISVGYKDSVPMQMSISGLTKPTSYGVSDGQISFKVNGGYAPYSYSVIDKDNSHVDSGSCDENISVSSNRIPGGDYILTISDSSGEKIEKDVFLYQAPQITSSDSGDISECASSSLSTNDISVTDPRDHCIDFSKTTGSLHLDDSSEINLGDNHDKRTIMFWFKTSDTNSLQFLFKEGGAINGISFYIKDGYLYANMWKQRISFGDMKTNLINQNSWHHAALTWDEDEVVNDKGFKAYIDGNLINSLKGLNLPSHSGDIWIGNKEKSLMQDNTLSTGDAIYNGQMDDFKLWNKPLTEQQVRDEMAKSAKSTIDNLVVQYDFNDPTGNIKDISGNSYDFTENAPSVPYKSLYSVEWENGASGFTRTVSSFGAAEYSYVLTNEKGGSASGSISVNISDANKFMTAEAIVHNPCKGESNGMIELRPPCAMHFDGNPSKQRIDCGSKFMDNLNQFTMEGWVRFDVNDMSSGRHSFFGQDDTIEFGIYNSNPNQFHIWSSRGGGAYFPLSIYPNDLNWHHFALVGSGTQYIFYVDGKMVGTPFTHTNIGSGGYGQGKYNSNNVFIGGSVFDGVSSASNTFKGDMYKVGFWNRALSSIELKNIFDNNLDYSGDETGLIAGYNFYEGEGNILNAAGEDNPHTARISSASNLPQWDAFKYLWSNGETTKKIEGLPAGDYTVKVELSSGCTLSRDYTITEPATAVSVSLDVQAEVCDGQEIDISANVTDGTTDMRYFFFEGDTALPKSKENHYEKSFVYDSNKSIIPLKVRVVDKNGCSAESVVKELHVYPIISTQPIKKK